MINRKISENLSSLRNKTPSRLQNWRSPLKNWFQGYGYDFTFEDPFSATPSDGDFNMTLPSVPLSPVPQSTEFEEESSIPWYQSWINTATPIVSTLRQGVQGVKNILPSGALDIGTTGTTTTRARTSSAGSSVPLILGLGVAYMLFRKKRGKN